MYTYIYICIHVHICMYTYVYIHMYLYVCIDVCLETWAGSTDGACAVLQDKGQLLLDGRRSSDAWQRAGGWELDGRPHFLGRSLESPRFRSKGSLKGDIGPSKGHIKLFIAVSMDLGVVLKASRAP